MVLISRNMTSPRRMLGVHVSQTWKTMKRICFVPPSLLLFPPSLSILLALPCLLVSQPLPRCTSGTIGGKKGGDVEAGRERWFC